MALPPMERFCTELFRRVGKLHIMPGRVCAVAKGHQNPVAIAYTRNYVQFIERGEKA